MNRHASLLTRQLLISALLLSVGLGCGGAKSGAKAPSASASAYPVVGRFTPIYMLKQYEGESEPLIDMSASGGEGGSAAKTGDHDEPVLYWSDAQRSAHTIEVKGGLIIDSTGAPLDPKLDLPEHKERGGEAIYVMDVMGNIYYCFDAKYGRIHHSTLAGGQPVAAAGAAAAQGGAGARGDARRSSRRVRRRLRTAGDDPRVRRRS